MRYKPIPPKAVLDILFLYDPGTGYLYARNPRKRGRTEPLHCKPTPGKYRVVNINKSTYMQHRVIWVMMTGDQIPEYMEVDHIDANQTNNAWSNLRLLSKADNVSRATSKTLSEVKMQAREQPSGRWSAEHWHPELKKRVRLGTFETKEIALAQKVKLDTNVK